LKLRTSLAARAQQPRKLPTIGFLGVGAPSNWSGWTDAFVQRLRELGWVEGRTISPAAQPASRTATGTGAFVNALSPSNSQIPRFQKS
jgi:hypothetical protein